MIRKRSFFTADRFLYAAALACASATTLVLAAVVGSVLVRGVPALNWKFLSSPVEGAGASGGVCYHLLGTLILVATAGALAAPVAIGVSVAHSVYLRGGRRGLKLALHILNGMPSILIGIAGMVVFVKFLGWGKSWLAGGLLLALMIIPTASLSLIERMAALPKRYVEAAVGLGLTRAQLAHSVVLPQSIGALYTGLLLGLARVCGETAPIMFTATVFDGATLPRGVIDSPVLSLSYHIFVLAQDSFQPAAASKAWAASAVLLSLVVVFSILAMPARLRAHEEADHE